MAMEAQDCKVDKETRRKNLIERANKKDFEASVELGYSHMIGEYSPKEEALKWFTKAVLIDDEKMGGMNQLMHCLTELKFELPLEAAELLQPKVEKLQEKILEPCDLEASPGARQKYYKPLFEAVEKNLSKSKNISFLI